MKTNGILLFALLAFLMLLPLQTGRADETEAAGKDKALAAAKTWLGQVDQGNYTESWQDAAGYFKKAVTQDQWLQSMKAYRQPLGKVLSRVLKSLNYTETLPGAPDGHYVVIRFNTSFENKSAAVETVTPMLCRDGVWRAAGYFIK